MENLIRAKQLQRPGRKPGPLRISDDCIDLAAKNQTQSDRKLNRKRMLSPGFGSCKGAGGSQRRNL